MSKRGFMAAFLGLVLALILAACTSAPSPTDGASAKESAQRELNNFIGLGQTDVALNEEDISRHLDQVAAVLNRIDSQPEVLSAFQQLLEEVLGKSIPTSATFAPPLEQRLVSRQPPGMLTVPAGQPASQATPPSRKDRFTDSAAWRFITEFVKTLIGSQVPGGEVLDAADPEVARAILISRTRTASYNRCFDNLSSCADGSDPAFNKVAAGDYAEAFKIMASTAATVPSGGSVYDGTYTGTFTYEYQEEKPDAEGRFVWGPWIAARFTLTVTLRSLAPDVVFRQAGATSVALPITHVVVSDPDFGAGASGIAPLFGSAATLPLDLPTTPLNPSLAGMGMVILFPNGATLLTENRAGALSVGFDGRTLSNSLDPGIQGRTWIADTPQGPVGPPNPSGFSRNYKYTSWRLQQ